MPRLLLLRHAKADAPQGTPDRERPLAERGREQAARMGAYLAAEGLLPDRVVVSPARRTRETVDLVLGALGRRGSGSEVPVEQEPRLYEAAPETIVAVARGLEDACVLLVGHNPGLGEAARGLAGEGAPDDLARLRARFPTAALAVIDVGVIDVAGEGWRELAPAQGRLERFVTPEDLGAASGD